MSDLIRPTVHFSLTVADGNKALAFYAEAFGAEEVFRMPDADGGVAHAEFKIGNSTIYLSEEDPHQFQAFAMPEGTTASCLFSIATEDADAAYARAIEAGATSILEPDDQFWGVRSAAVRDPFGYRWSFGQVTEELSNEEVAKRAAELFGG